jgi:hypothetical protein
MRGAARKMTVLDVARDCGSATSDHGPVVVEFEARLAARSQPSRSARTDSSARGSAHAALGERWATERRSDARYASSRRTAGAGI